MILFGTRCISEVKKKTKKREQFLGVEDEKCIYQRGGGGCTIKQTQHERSFYREKQLPLFFFFLPHKMKEN